jgi:hypothetical protein
MMTISLSFWFVSSTIISIFLYTLTAMLARNTKYEKHIFPYICAFILILTALLTLRSVCQKNVRIEVANNKTLSVYFDDKLKISAPVTDILYILTLSRQSPKTDIVRTEIRFPGRKINLYDNQKSDNKKVYDDFLMYLEKKQKFTYGKVPFTRMLSKHAVQYVRIPDEKAPEA